jgi:hypothetical protein
VGDRGAPSPATVAARWTSQLPPRPWTVAGPGPRGVPGRRAFAPAVPASRRIRTDLSAGGRSRRAKRRGVAGTIDPRGLGLPFRAARASRDPRRATPKRLAWVLLSWPRPLRPSAVLHRCVHSRRRATEVAAPSGRGFHLPTSRSVRVVSHHLDGFLRTGAAGLLRPAPGPGVRRVPNRPPSALATGRSRDTVEAGTSSSRRTTLRRVFLAGSRTASLRPLPSCRCRPSRRTVRSAPGRCSVGEFVAIDPRCRWPSLAPPMGFCPLRGPSTPARPTRSPRRSGEPGDDVRRSGRPARDPGWRFTRRPRPRSVSCTHGPPIASATSLPRFSDPGPTEVGPAARSGGSGASGVCPEAEVASPAAGAPLPELAAGPEGCRPP